MLRLRDVPAEASVLARLYPSSRAAGCNSPPLRSLSDRGAFHIPIFKRMSYGCCKRRRCDTRSFFQIFAVLLDRCYSATVEVGRFNGRLMDELAAAPPLTSHRNAGNPFCHKSEMTKCGLAWLKKQKNKKHNSTKPLKLRALNTSMGSY